MYFTFSFNKIYLSENQRNTHRRYPLSTGSLLSWMQQHLWSRLYPRELGASAMSPTWVKVSNYLTIRSFLRPLAGSWTGCGPIWDVSVTVASSALPRHQPQFNFHYAHQITLSFNNLMYSFFFHVFKPAYLQSIQQQGYHFGIFPSS